MRSHATALAAVVCLGLAAPVGAAPPAVEFNRDIRPILSDACFQCHGPDKAKRKADLRLDREDDAKADRGGSRVIAPGKPADSELIRRVTSDDPDERMPPPKTGRKLSKAEVELLKRWVEQGAKWQPHWAFISPKRPALPAVKDAAWVRTPIDTFVLARLQREGLKPSPEAPKEALIRRVTLDLTGLPPTPEEVDAFLKDASPDAYEKVVDRLLRSPRYGERMAWRWLEAARYADTSGYQSDGERFMWRWRDWVIDAYNANMPFDRFVIEQTAGDMLPNPTLDQRIATGFNRNHRGNGEGGIIPEEYAVEYVVDRVETTATVFLGLTMGCGRCHDHKFDPISQREFYRVFAYFNNVPERGKAVKYGNSPPFIPAPTADQQEQLRQLQAKLKAAEARWAKLRPDVDAARAEWERTFRPAGPVQWFPGKGLVAHYPLDGDGANAAGARKPAAFHDGEAAFADGPLGKAAAFDGKRFLLAGNVGDFGFLDRFSFSAWVYLDGPTGGAVLSRTAEVPESEGYAVLVRGGKVQVNLVKRWLDDALRVETNRTLEPGRWHHLAVTYDATRVAKGIRVYIDGQPEPTKVLLDDLNQTFQTAEPFRIGSGGGPESRFRGHIDDLRVYDITLSPNDIALLATPEPITDLLKVPAARRSSFQVAKLRAYFLAEHAPEAIRQARRERIGLREAKAKLVESFPTVMVMEEMPTPRDTFVLTRGEYDKRGEKVTPGVPAVFPPLPPGAPNNRLGFARWLVSPDNPLTARVAVNRAWQLHFGSGLVKTVEDFGSQSEPPSHPELLDWLATEFVQSGWDVKRLHKRIVMSGTYRQSARVTKELHQKDPDNRLLARGPRVRLSAEMVRDQALSASGLLVEKLGGPSVKPYQPPGLWKELAGGYDYVPDKGAKLYRRSLYTFWKRTVAPPSMVAFDAAGRETTCVRETRTNTPLQALTLLNDVTFVEASRVLAQRAMREGGPNPEGRITRGFRLVLGRAPRDAELRVLLDGFRFHLAEYRKDRQAALKLLSAGEAPRDPKLDVAELAALTAVASVILNLDEAITKE